MRAALTSIALAAAASFPAISPAAAAIVTTNYSVSGGALSGTFSLDFDDTTSTYSLSAADLLLGGQFDMSNAGMVQEIPANPVHTLGGTVNGVTFVNPSGNVDDFLTLFVPTSDLGTPTITYSLDGLSGTLSGNLQIDRTNVSGSSSDFVISGTSGTPAAGTFSLDFDSGTSTYSLTDFELLIGQLYDLSNAGLVQEDPSNPVWTIGGTLNGVASVGNGTTDFLFFFNPALATSNGGLIFSLGDLEFPLNQQITITQLGSPPPEIPEPASWAMMLTGFAAVGLALRRRRAQRGYAVLQ